MTWCYIEHTGSNYQNNFPYTRKVLVVSVVKYIQKCDTCIILPQRWDSCTRMSDQYTKTKRWLVRTSALFLFWEVTVVTVLIDLYRLPRKWESKMYIFPVCSFKQKQAETVNEINKDCHDIRGCNKFLHLLAMAWNGCTFTNSYTEDVICINILDTV